jgi:hypothetical protein
MPSITMFGFTILLMAIADRLAIRKYDKQIRCNICNQKFQTIREAEEHRNELHDATSA